MESSKLFIFSIGYVANNKELKSDVIQVVPVEHLNMINGEINSNPVSLETEGTDLNNQNYTTKVISDTSIEATWLKLCSNRKTSPDVRRGEVVLIWKYADTDQYFWSSTGINENLRKGETVVYTFSSTADESEDGTAKGNCYYLEVSTHLGQITLETTTKMGELTNYAIQLNTKDGYLLIQDGLNNAIELDSKNTKITLQNSKNTTVVLDEENINCQANDTISLTADKNVNITCKDLKINANNSIEISTKDFDINSSNKFNVTTNSYGVNSPNMLMNIQKSQFNGNCDFTGTVTTSDTVVNGTMVINNTLNVTGLITCNGINSSAPINGPRGSI